MVVLAQCLQILGLVIVTVADVVNLIGMVTADPARLAPSASVLVALEDERSDRCVPVGRQLVASCAACPSAAHA
ncbi:hypothetical protein [Streptomyces chryseus]|uniref:hypothetical protein n=1 Tax=Streptomyces chryseus TaxID=68186 RepID=UPI00142F1043|nr:hypothetical protein [Streptomyces chryseus]